MALKGWVLNRVNQLFTRVDLPPRATSLGQALMRRTREQRTAGGRNGGGHEGLESQQHLGAYAALIAAFAEEVLDFLASHGRRHRPIGEYDPYIPRSTSNVFA